MWNNIRFILKELILIILIRLTSATYYYNLKKECGPSQYKDVVFCDGITIGNVDIIEHKIPIRNVTVQHSNIPKLNKIYMPSLQYLTMTSCQIEEIHDQVFFYSSNNLEYINLSGNNLKMIPLNVFSKLQYLQYLNISNNRLKEIQSLTFAGLRVLKIIDLSYNQINELRQNVFLHLSNRIRKIDLSNNIIQIINNRTFADTFWLKYLFLQNNLIQEIQTNTFGGFEHIEEINLSNNNIKKLHEHFLPINRIKLLNISYNNLKELDYNTYGSGIIDLSNNLIKTIDNRTFEDSFKLKVLNLSNNHLNTIDCIEFSLLEDIKSIDLSNNNITKIKSDIFKSNLNLTDVNLAHNHLESIEFLESICNIVHLNLSAALGDEIEVDRLLKILSNEQKCIREMQQQPQLKSLDLTYNQLEQINLKLLQEVKNPQFLYLEGNNLTEINFESFTEEQLDGLEEIGLGLNEWNCTYLSNMAEFFLSKNVRLRLQIPLEDLSTSHRYGLECTN